MAEAGRRRRLGSMIRQRVRQGRRRVGWALQPTIVAALAAGLSFFIASEILGHQAAMFAPIATWVCLGFQATRQLRKTAELALGVTLGVGFGELFATIFGQGPIQVTAVVIIAALAARFIDRGEMFTMQAGVQSLIIVSMPVALLSDGVMGRWTDALVGGSVALLAAAILPGDVIGLPRRRAAAAITELADMLVTLAGAYRAGDTDLANDALAQGRRSQPVLDDLDGAVRWARQVATVNPTYRHRRPELERLARTSQQADLAMRNLRVIARRSHATTNEDSDRAMSEVFDSMTDALRALAADVGRGDDPATCRRMLIDITKNTNPREFQNDWKMAAVWSILRSFMADMLVIAGMSRAEINVYLPGD